MMDFVDAVLTTAFTAKYGSPIQFRWTGEGRQRTLACLAGERGLAARVPTEHSYFDEDEGVQVTVQTTSEAEWKAAERLAYVLMNGKTA